MTTVLLAHATADILPLYRPMCGDARVVPFTSPHPGMSAAYRALAQELRRRGPLLPALLERLKVPAAQAGPIVMAWWSGGYGFARELAADPSAVDVAAWVNLDGLHTVREADGTPSDDGVAWMVELARKARDGGPLVVLTHTDVPTYGEVTSTTATTREVLRLLGIPEAEWPRAGAVGDVEHRAWGNLVVCAYNTERDAKKEHIAALRGWGPAIVGFACARVALTSAATLGTTTATAPPIPPPASTATSSPRTTTATAPAIRWTPAPAIGPLRIGHQGPSVTALQLRLTSAGFPAVADGDFGPKTQQRLRDFQRAAGLPQTGELDDATAGALRDKVSSPPDKDPYEEPAPPALRVPPPLSDAERVQVFGSFEWTPIPGAGGNVRILGGWERDNIRMVEIPQLRNVPPYLGPRGLVRCHRLIVDPLRELFDQLERRGLLRYLVTYDGAHVPRLVRDGESLSNHSWGSDIDINALSNMRGRPAMPRDKPGTVLPIVDVAVELGWGSGGVWPTPDWMHLGWRGGIRWTSPA